MTLSVIRSRALAGMEAPPVTVEVHLAPGLPAFNIVGLAETEVKESRDRVRAALQTSSFEVPARRITVNLAPADLPKESSRFDLPIAVGVLVASGQIPHAAVESCEFAGELALTGALRPIRGALAMTYKAAKEGRTFILPGENAAEAALVTGADVRGAATLNAVVAHLLGQEMLPQQRPAPPQAGGAAGYPDLREVRGQTHAKRALEVAAAGRHSLLFSGPPGTGKSMLASRLPGLLPPMDDREAIESAAIRSLTAEFDPGTWRQRQFRSPHHTASAVALVGGGSNPKPGEISLAHHSVLFLDEIPEFDRKVLEVLREPLESGRIHISRAARQVEFPANFQLLAAMNPCPCGYSGQPNGRCRCTPEQVARYRAKISGPLLDRIDLCVEVPALSADELRDQPSGESSETVRARVTAAYQRQLDRQGRVNSLLGVADIERYCVPDAAGDRTLRTAITRLELSARAYHRILKVARTIADLAGSEQIGSGHIAEAVGYRRRLDPIK